MVFIYCPLTPFFNFLFKLQYCLISPACAFCLDLPRAFGFGISLYCLSHGVTPTPLGLDLLCSLHIRSALWYYVKGEKGRHWTRVWKNLAPHKWEMIARMNRGLVMKGNIDGKCLLILDICISYYNRRIRFYVMTL